MINIQNIDDNECFKWCLVRYLNPADHQPARITKADKDFAKKLDFKDEKFPVKVRDNQKIEKRVSSALVFFVIKIEKNILFMYLKNVAKKNMLNERKKKGTLCYYQKFHYIHVKSYSTP